MISKKSTVLFVYYRHNAHLNFQFAQSAGAVEYTDFASAEG